MALICSLSSPPGNPEITRWMHSWCLEFRDLGKVCRAYDFSICADLVLVWNGTALLIGPLLAQLEMQVSQ